MKTFLTLAVVAATLATSGLAQASVRAGGHWEWQSRVAPGPNKSNLPQQVRVWVRDSSTKVAACNCAMMKMDAANCMMDMQGERAKPSAG